MRFFVPLALVTIAIILSACNQSQTQPTTQGAKPSDETLKNALNLYSQKKSEGVDFSNSPCLGKIADDWVLDIAHKPRIDADNKAENQCADFREGRAHHFIELDPQGQLINTY